MQRNTSQNPSRLVITPCCITGEQQAFPVRFCNEPVMSSAVSTVCTNVDSEPASSMGRLFGDMTKCSIGQITINVNPNIHPTTQLNKEQEFDEVLKTTVFHTKRVEK